MRVRSGRFNKSARSTNADSLAACRVADQAALDMMAPYIDHIVKVSDAEVAQAMRDLYTDTHNVAEGAGAASFAAAMQERSQLQGLCVGTTISGGNVDTRALAKVLQNL